MDLTLRLDGCAECTRRARGVVVGNVGELQGGVALLPEADPTDGLLDVAVLGPVGLWGWVRIAGRVLTGGVTQDGRLERWQVRRLELHAHRPQSHELDGDPQDRVDALVFEVRPAALVVRVPR